MSRAGCDPITKGSSYEFIALFNNNTIPGLSEKNILLDSIHGGGQDTNSSDRYKSF